jgi:HK97 family phage major capsid protein
MKTLAELRAEAADLSVRLASPGDNDNIAELTVRANEVADEIEQRLAEATAADEARARLASSDPAPRTPSSTPAAPAAAGMAGQGTQEPEGRSIGQTFVQSVVAEARANAYSGSFSVEVPGDVRALIDTAGFPVQPTRLPGIQAQTTKDRTLKIVDLIDRRPTSTNVIEWIREDSLTNAAAETTEGSAKPESTFVLSQQSSTAATIAHFLNVTRQAADDDAQMQGYVEGRLVYGLNLRLENQVLAGNGTAPNLRGITTTAGIGTYTAGTATEAALISIRKAITTAQVSEYFPDAVALNPIDWEAIELSTDTAGMFRVSPNVQQALTPTIWGLNVVVSNALTGTVFGTTGGKFLVGAFREGATLWERDGIRLFLSDSHASNFTSNILTLLAECRAALTVWRPKAFVYGTLGASRT